MAAPGPARGGQPFDLGPQLASELGKPAGLDQVAGELTVQGQHLVDDRRRGMDDVVHVAFVAFDHAGRVLPGNGLGDESGARLPAQPKRMFGDDASGKRVVGDDRRLPVEQRRICIECMVEDPTGSELGQPAPHP